MNCKKAQQEIATGTLSDNTLEHMKGCSSCRMLSKQVQEAMELLDQEIPAFSDLTGMILEKRREQAIIPKKPSYLSHIAQLAAVITIGIMIGIVLGKNANPDCFRKDKRFKDNSLQEYLESHHLKGKEEFGRF
jgi:hypothetical protein